jgi:hypothetical protein
VRLVYVVAVLVALLKSTAYAEPDSASTPTPDPSATAESPQSVPTVAVPSTLSVEPAPSSTVQPLTRGEMLDLCQSQSSRCDWTATLAPLERASVERALRARGLVVEPQPWNKVIDSVDVFVEPVIVEGARYLGWVNSLRIESRESVVRREVLIGPGEVWDQPRIEETARRLRDPAFASVAVVVPVKRPGNERVSVLVVTRDIWSLRFNTNYRFQNGQLTDLNLSLSEQNFLGLRKIVALVFGMSQDQIAMGPSYIDRNLAGRQLKLSANMSAIFARSPLLSKGSFTGEGTESAFELSRPLWSLATKWGYGVALSHRYAIDRLFRGTSVRTYDDPATADREELRWEYRQRRFNATVSGQRQWGTTIKQRLSFGYSLESQRPTVLADFAGSDDQRAAFIRDVLPRSERNSLLFASASLFTPVYRTTQNVSTFDLAEDVQFGPTASVAIGVAPTFLGSTRNFVRSNVDVGWTLPWCDDGSIRAKVSASFRIQSNGLVDNTADAQFRVVTPSIQLGRLVAETSVSTRWNPQENRFYSLGSQNGLRGFLISEFSGQRRTVTQLEARSRPWKLWAFRFGGVVFYDVGSAASSFATMRLHQDVGFGLRALTPQTSRELFRFDLAFPLDGGSRGVPQFIGGFGSEF